MLRYTRTLIFSIFMAITPPLMADVIYSPYEDFHLAASLELIGSKEFSFTRQNTIDIWGGLGMVSRSFESFGPSLGAEMALEIRHYFKKDRYIGWNLGVYAGLAYMSHYTVSYAKIIHNNNSAGIVPGLKITYKKRYNNWLIGEPYVGISNIFSREIIRRESINQFENDGFVVTIGFRLGIQYQDSGHRSQYEEDD